MANPPPAPLQDRLLRAVQTLQFGWFCGHLSMIFFTLRYVLYWVTLNGGSKWAVMSYRVWREHFSLDPSVIGGSFLVNGNPMTIVGVTEKSFHGVYAIMDMDGYYPLSAPFGDTDDPVKNVRDVYTQRENRRLSLLARLKPGVSVQQARASLTVVAQRLAQDFPAIDKDIAIRAFPEKLARPEPDPDYQTESLAPRACPAARGNPRIAHTVASAAADPRSHACGARPRHRSGGEAAHHHRRRGGKTQSRRCGRCLSHRGQ